MHFAAINTHASETSIGFANTWGVLAFETKKARDAYVDASTDMATRAITRSEIGKYCQGDVKPFSGDRYMIGLSPREEIEGLIGEVYIGSEHDAQAVRPLND